MLLQGVRWKIWISDGALLTALLRQGTRPWSSTDSAFLSGLSAIVLGESSKMEMYTSGARILSRLGPETAASKCTVTSIATNNS